MPSLAYALASFLVHRSDLIDVMIHIGRVGKTRAVWLGYEAIDHVGTGSHRQARKDTVRHRLRYFGAA